MLLRWRESPHRLSRVDPRYHRRRFFAAKLTHFPAAVPPGTTVHIWGAGPTGRAWARALRARGARQHIETWLQHCGLRPWEDYLAVA